MRLYKLTAVICLYFLFVVTGCNTASPEKYFDVAVLNSNMLVGFSNGSDLREFESPSVKMSETGGQPIAMKRSEVVQSKIDFVEANLEKIKELKQTDDTKEMLQTSLALHEYILPVYKSEYQQLAKLYDEGAANESIQVQAKAIHDKYNPGFDDLYNKLINTGKSFAERHDIKVNWAN